MPDYVPKGQRITVPIAAYGVCWKLNRTDNGEVKSIDSARIDIEVIGIGSSPFIGWLTCMRKS